MTAERTGSQESRLGKDISSQNAALRGASLAFGKPLVKPKPQINNYAGKDGALAAATKAGGHSRQASRSRAEGLEEEQRLGYQNTGSSVGTGASIGYSERGMVQQRLNQLGGGNFLQLPKSNGDQSKSPSFIAATLAASRSASISPNPTGSNRPSAELRRQASFIARSPSVRSVSSRESSDQVLDTTPIPPTTSLIGMFEQNSKSLEFVKRPAVRRAATAAVQRRSPGSGHASSSPPPRSRTLQPPSATLIKSEIKSPKPLPAQTRSIPKSLEPSEPTLLTQKEEAKSSKPALPKIKSSPRTESASTPPVVAKERGISPPKPPLARIQSFPKAVATPPPVTQRPLITAAKAAPIPSKTQPSKAENDDDGSSDESFVSASDYQPSFRAALSMQNRRLTSTSAVSVNSSVAVDSLANAIVASSLASSRAASPSRQQSLHPNPPLPPRRNGRNHLFHNPKDISRTPSPSKPGQLRTTMRKPRSKDEIDEGEKRRSRKHLMKKHPNKHHEGDRKRWRDTITERERKRYEAVWASNKGLFAPSNSPADEMSVCNLVARDIFSRSRLHVDVLEEVYSLVDRQGNGRLEKEEFVVGLWLIDQRLKGRKLPIKVTESVWKSVGILGGIKVRRVHH